MGIYNRASLPIVCTFASWTNSALGILYAGGKVCIVYNHVPDNILFRYREFVEFREYIYLNCQLFSMVEIQS